MPTNRVIRMMPSQARTVRALRASGGRKAGTPSETASTPVRAAQPEEKARSTRKSVRSWVAARSRGRRRRRLPSRDPADEPVGEHAREAHHEEVGGDREEIARLPQAAQVHGRDARDEEHAERDAIVVQRGERGGDRGHARGHAHRHRQHVVDEQRRPRDEPGHLAQVVLGDDVGAAAQGIGQDGLPVRAHHHRDEHRDREADRDRVDERGGAREHQDEQDLLGGVGDGGERVGREHRERGRLREPLVPGLRRSER